MEKNWDLLEVYKVQKTSLGDKIRTWIGYLTFLMRYLLADDHPYFAHRHGAIIVDYVLASPSFMVSTHV